MRDVCFVNYACQYYTKNNTHHVLLINDSALLLLRFTVIFEKAFTLAASWGYFGGVHHDYMVNRWYLQYTLHNNGSIWSTTRERRRRRSSPYISIQLNRKTDWPEIKWRALHICGWGYCAATGTNYLMVHSTTSVYCCFYGRLLSTTTVFCIWLISIPDTFLTESN